MKMLLVGAAILASSFASAETTTYGTIDTLEYRGGRIGGARAEATLVFPGATLSEWTPKFSWFRTSSDALVFGASGPTFACNVKEGNDGTSDGVYADFQRWHNNQVYSIRVFFYQELSGVMAYVSHAHFSYSHYFLLGEDMVALYYDHPELRSKVVNSQGIACGLTGKSGYAIDHILMERKAPSVVRPDSAADVASDVLVKADADLRLDAAEFFPDGTNAANFNVDGRLSVVAADGTLAGDISGRGTVEFVVPPNAGASAYYEDYVQEGGTIIARNMLLSSLTNITAELKGGNAPYGASGARGVRFSGDGKTERWAMQVYRGSGDGRFLVHMPIKLEQVGTDIRVTITDRIRYMFLTNETENVKTYAPGGKIVMGMDMEDPHYVGNNVDYYTTSISYDGVTSGYGMHLISSASTGVWHKVTIAGENLMATGGVFCVGAADGSRMTASVTSRTTVPQNGLIRIKSGGELALDYKGVVNSQGIGMDTSRILVETNGVLNVANQPGGTKPYYQIGIGQLIEIRGGSLVVGEGSAKYTSKADINCYFNFVSFIGGGTMSCPTWVRVGNRIETTCTATVWRVIGKGVATCNCGLNILAYRYNKNFELQPSQALLLAVEDASGDEEPDLIINGRVNHYSDVIGLDPATVDPSNPDSWSNDARNMSIVKDYNGTVRFNDVYRPYPMTRILDGTLMLGVSGSTTSEQSFELSGGAFAVAEATTNTVGTIKVVKSGQIVLGDQASLSVADCSSEAWASGATVEIVGDLATSELRFGDSASALTAAQRQMLRYKGKRVRLDETGRVSLCGLIIVVK